MTPRLLRLCLLPLLLCLGCGGGGGGSSPASPSTPSCTFAVAPSSAAVPAGGGTGSVSVTANAGCAWTATAVDAWVTVTSGASGSGDGSVAWSAAANGGAARIGTLKVAGKTVTLSQASAVPLAITGQPSDALVLSGQTANFAVTAVGTGTLTYQWARNGTDIPGATSATYTTPATSLVDSGATFSVAVSAGGSKVTSRKALLTVLAAGGSAPLLFVTSVPGTGFTHQLNTFGNHGSDIANAVPGGDLYLRYVDGTLRNLTQEAGFGVAGSLIQGGAKAICVRQPCVYWDGSKALFSMMLGGPTKQYDNPVRTWQLYEVTGFAKGQTAVITKVANQPAYNNINPIYGSDDQIIFSSDSPLYGMAHTYPQKDEYENTPTNTGIWKLNPVTGALKMIEHAPSGVFDLYLDSFGRLLFTKWDHLKRDQQADLTRYHGGTYNPFDFADESPAAVKTAFPAKDAAGKLQADANGVLYDYYPEARDPLDPTRDPNESLQDFNQFFIWQINEDGSEEETLNHVGRHEFGGTFMDGVFLDDPNLTYLLSAYSVNAAIRNTITADSGLFQLKEDQAHPGTYYGVYAKEFARQAAGRVLEFTMPPGTNPETVAMKDYTNATLDNDPTGSAPPLATMTGHYRNPLKLADGSMIVAHTPEYRQNADDSADPIHPAVRYVFQIKPLLPNPAGSDNIAGPSLTGGIVKDVRWWTDDATPHQYLGPLNETDMVEVAPRPRPLGRSMATDPIEQQVLAEEGVDEATLRSWLVKNNLALIVSRNVTLRDRADIGQPFNLQVPGGTSNVPSGGKVYSVQNLQVLEGDLTRAYAPSGTATPGRRVYVKPLHNGAKQPAVQTQNPPNPGAPAGSVRLGKDGSLAAFVPAGRALSWQLLDPLGKSVVRERVWVSFPAGEIRTCATCHGLNKQTLNALPIPTNKPQALRDLLTYWKTLP